MKKRKNNFVKNVRELLGLISERKKELRELKNSELKSLDLKEREEIKLVKAESRKQRLEILKRYEKGQESLGEALLRKKNQELGSRLSVERKSLNKTNKDIGKIGKNLRGMKK